MGLVIAMISGALMSIQGIWNTQVTKTTGMWVANMWVQLTAFIVCVGLWLVTEKDAISTLVKVEPKYMLAGGVLGAGITWSVVKSIEKLGPAKAILLIVITQISIAYLIEIFGIFQVEKQPFEMKKLIGILIAVIGIWIFEK